MSLSTFSAGSQDFLSADEPIQEYDEATAEEASGGNGRLLKIVAGLLVLVLLAAAAWFFLLRGTPAEETVIPDPVAPAGAAEPAADPAAPIVPVPEVAPPAIDGAVGNDPFNPLIFTVPEVAEDVAAETATGDTATTDTAGGATTDTTDTTGTTEVTPVVDPSTTAPAPITVMVVDVAEDNTQATIKIDSADYTVRLGQVFATYFKVLSFQTGTCATLQYGDQPMAAPLCETESATVQ